MEYLWIVASVLAAFFQALRLAALKELNRHLSTMVTSYVRVLFGLPILLFYLFGVMLATGEALPPMNARFLLFSTLAAVTQFGGTALIVRLFQLGNFAVGTMLVKTDVILTAIVGSIFFSEVVSPLGWLAILITVGGVMIASAGRMPASAWTSSRLSLFEVIAGQQTRIGLLSGLVFAISYLALREAILALGAGPSPIMRAALSGAVMTALSFAVLGVWLLIMERPGLSQVWKHTRLCAILGLTSALGTIGWFFASALNNAAYVAAVAQVQIVFTLALSRYWFNEPIHRIELVGIAVILAGVILFRAV